MIYYTLCYDSHALCDGGQDNFMLLGKAKIIFLKVIALCVLRRVNLYVGTIFCFVFKSFLNFARQICFKWKYYKWMNKWCHYKSGDSMWESKAIFEYVSASYILSMRKLIIIGCNPKNSYTFLCEYDTTILFIIWKT